MDNESTDLNNDAELVLKELPEGNVLGSSLAHGLSKRALREDYETFNKRFQSASKKFKSTSKSRAAKFRSNRKGLIYLYKENTVYREERGEQDGCDKQATFLLITMAANKSFYKNEHAFVIEGHYLSARYPSKWRSKQVASASKHCIAQMLRTVGVDNIHDVINIFNRTFEVAAAITVQCKEGILAYEQRYGILSKHGVVIAVCIKAHDLTYCKTAIAYAAMTPKKAERLKKMFNEKHIVIPWKNNRAASIPVR